MSLVSAEVGQGWECKPRVDWLVDHFGPCLTLDSRYNWRWPLSTRERMGLLDEGTIDEALAELERRLQVGDYRWAIYTKPRGYLDLMALFLDPQDAVLYRLTW